VYFFDAAKFEFSAYEASGYLPSIGDSRFIIRRVGKHLAFLLFNNAAIVLSHFFLFNTETLRFSGYRFKPPVTLPPGKPVVYKDDIYIILSYQCDKYYKLYFPVKGDTSSKDGNTLKVISPEPLRESEHLIGQFLSYMRRQDNDKSKKS